MDLSPIIIAAAAVVSILANALKLWELGSPLLGRLLKKILPTN